MSVQPSNAEVSEEAIASLFKSHGWKVVREPSLGSFRADLVISKHGVSYAVEVKALSEGRPDRVIALLSQAILQAQAFARAGNKLQPLAVVYIPAGGPSLFNKVQAFFHRFAPNVAIGLVASDGARRFIGRGLESLNAAPVEARKFAIGIPSRASDLFSDLNQWMLKVLLAPEIPPNLLSAPRAVYRNASELSEAARVSVMSASRFVNRLHEEGFLEESGFSLRLVRRPDLFHRWQSVAMRSAGELRMCFLNPSSGQSQLRRLVSRHKACLGLFAAADALHIGHVSGVPPYVYVMKLPRSEQEAWKELVPARPGEPAHLILRQALYPKSIFRGAVDADGVKAADALQVWLDASAHPSRGKEQAEFLSRKVLRNIFGGAE